MSGDDTQRGAPDRPEPRERRDSGGAGSENRLLCLRNIGAPYAPEMHTTVVEQVGESAE
jgi:hypothetical protein